MEQNFYKNESLNKIEKEVQEKVSFARKHALSEAEYESLNQEDEKMQMIQNQRELTDEEVEYFYTFREKLNGASIEVETLIEMRRVMELLGFNEHSLIDTMAHENAHGNRAEELGAEHHGYRFLLLNGNNGELIVKPRAVLSIPDEWDKNKKIIVESESLRAPKDYGGEMSDDDKEEFRKLNL